MKFFQKLKKKNLFCAIFIKVNPININKIRFRSGSVELFGP